MFARHHPARSARLPWAAGVAAAGAAVALLTLTGPAGAAPAASAPSKPVGTDQAIVITDPVPAGFSSWGEVHAAQERFDTVADQIADAAQAPDGTGYGSIVTEPEHRQLRLYWKGTLPASVRALLARDTGVTVVVQRAAYSAVELQSEIDRMMPARPPGQTLSANQVTGAGPLADSSGLKVFVNGSAAAGRELPAVRAATVPVTVESAATPQIMSRANDSPAYWGGAKWYGRGLCSTGFAVRGFSTNKMLSAGHCANDFDPAFDGGGQASDYMGTVNSAGADPQLDALLIDTPSAGRIFVGGPGSGETTKRVRGHHGNYRGNRVCTSGAFSGTRCNITIIDTNLTRSFVLRDGTIVTYHDVVYADQQSGLNATGDGDSGGPVFSVSADDPTSVWAKGTITGGDSGTLPATCTGDPASDTRQCSSRVWYTDIVESLHYFGSDIVVG